MSRGGWGPLTGMLTKVLTKVLTCMLTDMFLLTACLTWSAVQAVSPPHHPLCKPLLKQQDSGYGRELGPFGLENFLNIKQVTTYLSDKKWDWYNPPESRARL